MVQIPLFYFRLLTRVTGEGWTRNNERLYGLFASWGRQNFMEGTVLMTCSLDIIACTLRHS